MTSTGKTSKTWNKRSSSRLGNLRVYFVCFVELNQILAVALRSIVSHKSITFFVILKLMGLGVSQYSFNKLKLFLGFVGPHWEQHIAACVHCRDHPPPEYMGLNATEA